MKSTYVKKMAEQAFNKLVEAVEAGKSATLIEYLKTMARFHNYSVGNAILINVQKPEATQVAGFHTWRRLGRYVKRNERGIAIMAPIVWRRKLTHTDDEDQQERKEETTLAFKTAYVFDISQTNGKPLAKIARVKGDPADHTERLKEFISEQGIKLEYSDSIGSAEGVSFGGMIKIRKGLTAADEFSVLAHEFAHERMHKNRDNMPKEKKIREAEAEAVAYIVCYGIGLNTNSSSSDYIQLYNGDKKTLMESLDRIQRTASQILRAIMAEKGNVPQDVEEQSCLAEAA